MVAASLVDSLVEDGRELIGALQKADATVEFAAWIYNTDREEWELNIASSDFLRLSPSEAYQTVQRALATMPRRTIRLSNVTIIPLDKPIVKALRSAADTAADGEGLRVYRSVLNNVYIDDAYVYRI